MELSIVNGLALVRRQAAGSKILLVRTAPSAPWVLPTAQSDESLDQLLQSVRSELFPHADFTRLNELSRKVSTREGEVAFSFVGTDAELPAYFESSRFIDARWASFEEARHIARGDLEEVLSWSKHLLHKLPLKPATVVH